MIKSNKLSIFLACLILSIIISNSSVYASNHLDHNGTNISNNDTITTVDIRALCYKRDFESAYYAGKKAAAQTSNIDSELQAWYLMAMAASGKYDDAVAAAESMIASMKEPSWGLFALAATLMIHPERNLEAAAASEKAFAGKPDHPDFIWLRGEVLERTNKDEQALIFVDSQLKNVKNPAELLVVKANAIMKMASRDNDEKRSKEGLAIYEEARRLDPNCVNALYSGGYYLFYTEQREQGIQLIKQALALSPYSKPIHSEFWSAIMNWPDLSKEKKFAEIETSIAKYLSARGDYPNALFEIYRQYRIMGLKDKQEEIATRLITNHSDSPAVEKLILEQANELRNQLGLKTVDPQHNGAYVKLHWEFIKRPKHYNKMLLGDAYRNLFKAIRNDKSISDTQLMEVIDGMMKYEKLNPHTTYPAAVLVLAERKNFRAAEQIGKNGLIAAEKRYEMELQISNNPKSSQEFLNFMSAVIYGAMGTAYQQEGRQDDAIQTLLKAAQLNEKDMRLALQLGQLFEEKKELNRAEEFYIKGSLIRFPNQPAGENDCSKALKALYLKRNGGETGYPEYLAKIKENDRVKRKQELLQTQIKTPKAIEPFSLKTLSGDTISLDKLKERVVVINFWATWCGPCVAEMPELQHLSEKYASDKDVAILTINKDFDLNELRAYMEKNKFTYTNMLDEGYSDKAKVFAVPTTWILDRQGNRVFETIGFNANLLEEFSWIIDELKQRK